MSALVHSRKQALTLAYMVERSDLIIAGEVKETRPWVTNGTRGWILSVAVEEALKGRSASSVAEVLSLPPIGDIAVGLRGIFFLEETVRHRQIVAVPTDTREAPAPWILAWGCEGLLPVTDPGFAQLGQHLMRLLDMDRDVIEIALDALVSSNARLRSDAAFDLSRYDRLGETISESGLDTMLSALQDRTFPDNARATLSRVISGLPRERVRLTGTLIDLIEAGIGSTGFQTEAAGLLTEFAAPEALDVLTSLADSEDDLVRAQALTGLGAIGNEDAVERLVSVSREHPDEGTRDFARQVLRNREL